MSDTLQLVVVMGEIQAQRKELSKCLVELPVFCQV